MVTKNLNQRKNAFKFTHGRRKEVLVAIVIRNLKEKHEDKHLAEEAVKDITCKKTQTRPMKRRNNLPMVVIEVSKIG